MHLGFDIGPLAIQSLVKTRPFIVRDLAQRWAHNGLKHCVNAVHHALAASEVLAQGNEVVERVGLLAEGAVLSDENRGVSQTEAVNALFDVPDHKVIIVPDNPLDDGLLHIIGILVFVQKYVRILLAHLGRNGGIL